MEQVKLVKCEICALLFEGLLEDECPKCRTTTLKVVAVYPKLEEDEIEINVNSEG